MQGVINGITEFTFFVILDKRDGQVVHDLRCVDNGDRFDHAIPPARVDNQIAYAQVLCLHPRIVTILVDVEGFRCKSFVPLFYEIRLLIIVFV